MKTKILIKLGILIILIGAVFIVYQNDNSDDVITNSNTNLIKDNPVTDTNAVSNTNTNINTEETENSYVSYPIVDTGQSDCYSDLSIIPCPNKDQEYYGQDSQYSNNAPTYTDNGDGTVTDNITQLMWQQDMGDKTDSVTAKNNAEQSTLAGYTDWRVPTIKELYSLILFTGELKEGKVLSLYIDDNYFTQPLGDTSKGEREIDAQTWSSTKYVSLTMNNDETTFGVNFIDGRIKGYGMVDPRTRETKTMYYRFVRGNSDYGINNFLANEDGTISDLATGLMWQEEDSNDGMDWQSALAYGENLELAGHSDWRLPSAKELQSILDYSLSPDTSNSAAIDPVFEISSIVDPNGKTNYPFFWSSTTHLDGVNTASGAAYVCFGECQGKMNGSVLDVHGAGAQRSDPKSGIESDYPQYYGPQGDIRYVYNYVRAVRDID